MGYICEKIPQSGDMSDPFLYLSKFLQGVRGRANLLRNRCDKNMFQFYRRRHSKYMSHLLRNGCVKDGIHSLPSSFTSFFLLFWVTSSPLFGPGRLHFLCQVVFTFWVRLSSLFGSGHLHFLGQVVFTFWVGSSSIFGLGRLHFSGQVIFTF